MKKHVEVSGCSECPFAERTPYESSCKLVGTEMLPSEAGARLPSCPMLMGPVTFVYTVPGHDGLESEPQAVLGNVFKGNDEKAAS